MLAAMTEPRSPRQTMELIARETRLRDAPVPLGLGERTAAPDRWLLHGGEFLLRTASGFGFHYQPGAGIAVERPDGADPAEEALWIKGSVYAAVASINGLVPLHASAVAHAGHVFAFTGPAGMGKSTLAAGLARHGLPLFCDDTLLLDLADPARIVGLPGHKRLKLTAEALALTGAIAEAEVGADTAKFYARPAAGECTEPLALALLVFLEDGEEPRWEDLRGAARFARLEDDHYTQALYLAAQRPDRAELFTLRARIAGQLPMARLVRPRSAEGFAASLDLAAERICGWSIEQQGAGV